MPRLTPRIAAVLATLVITACAPDAFNNMRAPQFNAFLNDVQARCQPLDFGPLRMTVITAPPGNEDNFAYWLNMTSRLFYQRITEDQYREGMRAWLPGPRTQRSTECVLAQLPPADQRPTSPPGFPGNRMYWPG